MPNTLDNDDYMLTTTGKKYNVIPSSLSNKRKNSTSDLVQNNQDKEERIIPREERLDSTEVSSKLRAPIPQTLQNKAQTSQWQGRVMCTNHHGYMIAHICVQESCGELLCPVCGEDHENRDHVGIYRTLSDLRRDISIELTQVHKSLLKSADGLVQV